MRRIHSGHGAIGEVGGTHCGNRLTQDAGYRLRAAEDREKELTRKCDQMKRDLDEAMEKPTSRETSLQDELMAATAVANEYRQNVENLTERIRKTQLEVKQRAVRRMRLLLFRQMRGSEAGLLHRWLNRVQAEQSRKLEQLWAKEAFMKLREERIN